MTICKAIRKNVAGQLIYDQKRDTGTNKPGRINQDTGVDKNLLWIWEAEEIGIWKVDSVQHAILQFSSQPDAYFVVGTANRSADTNVRITFVHVYYELVLVY